MKRFFLAVLFLAASVFPAAAQEYHDIDVDLPQYPEMVPVPDSPVYYAPEVDSNYFFYDGLYWDYYNDGWYSSPWYNGPWSFVEPIYVPTYLLWVPIRFYRRAPSYWRGWNAGRAPRWSEHWGRDWQARHNQIFRGPQRPGYARAPLPDYQRSYNRSNYPRAPQAQSQLHAQQYAYRPQERTVQQHYERRGMGNYSAPQVQQAPQRSEPSGNPAARSEPRREESRGNDARHDRDRR
jgi:hypothetical protein